MTNLETLLRTHGEMLTYLLFFSTLIVLALIELVNELGGEPVSRARRWPVNWGLTALNIILLGAIPVSGLYAADHALKNGIGLLNDYAVPLPGAFAIGFLLRSLFSWFVHFAMHKIPFLWRVHRVHHSDAALDVSTTVRFHPLEFFVSTPVTLGIIILFGIPPLAILVFEIVDAVIAVFSHANVRLPGWLDRGLNWLIVTPHMHRVHHSSHQPETDSNYGATLSCWDRLFGTYHQKRLAELKGIDIGLKECQDRRANSAWWLMTLPFRPGRIYSIRMTGQITKPTPATDYKWPAER